ncbi:MULTISPECIES: hypothetical protein [unclassified Methylobacterium]|uniref:hypothetical protein n=1 Tax=unclassified Methylobacterium TaxID=2615210 RepID=UPI00226A00B1|nr:MULTISPECIES: hypothetical protein [unclassified Methylobacterium]
MSDDAQPLGIRDIMSLATKLAERVIHTHNAGQPFSMNELEAVVKAAEFLQKHDMPWPGVVTEVIDGLVAEMDGVRADSSDMGVRMLPPR